ncbi:transporter [Silvimonas amylolytica]|uniref:MetA-pathway of phenol degradation n=1 Tax=Silvimonas amylolytica TaxID=449663 RepID=A0ABQ2PNY7_9NEIS|nr:transporter [Silvimonas amylolytica]GGP27086.1 hypothetical protein GCM10010971_29050 [Silvimonas amylolytica]
MRQRHNRAYRPVLLFLNWKLIGLPGVILMVSGVVAQATDIEPRSYTNAPIGLNFLVVGLSRADGGMSLDQAIPLDDAQLRVQTEVAAFVHVFELGGQSARFNVSVPYSSIHGTASYGGQQVGRDISGVGDSKFQISANFIGAPALSAAEFPAYAEDFVAGGSIQISAPTGQYDSSKLVNVGTHRWYVKPEVGFTERLGNWSIEGATGVTVFSTNHDFFGGKQREQDPVYSAQINLVRFFPAGVWAALSGAWLQGGRTTVNGVLNNDLQQNTRIGVTIAAPINRYNSVKLNYSSGVAVRTGTDFNVLNLAWQVRWGGGL